MLTKPRHIYIHGKNDSLVRVDLHLGWVYLLRNDAMPEQVKIGFTLDDPWERANQLSTSTSVPLPFRVVFAIKSLWPEELEKRVHAIFSGQRVSSNREFFYAHLQASWYAQPFQKTESETDAELVQVIRHEAKALWLQIQQYHIWELIREHDADGTLSSEALRRQIAKAHGLGEYPSHP